MPRLTPQNYRTLISVFTKIGYSVDRQEGSHIVMTKPGTPRPLVIPARANVPVFVIKNPALRRFKWVEAPYDLQ
jgi:predicted RNA binding protein YcfA (HicA-like mRNA interferase family)